MDSQQNSTRLLIFWILFKLLKEKRNRMSTPKLLQNQYHSTKKKKIATAQANISEEHRLKIVNKILQPEYNKKIFNYNQIDFPLEMQGWFNLCLK